MTARVAARAAGPGKWLEPYASARVPAQPEGRRWTRCLQGRLPAPCRGRRARVHSHCMPAGPVPGRPGPADRRPLAASGRIGSVMNAYNDVDGIPCAANQDLLTSLLRDAWGFTGTVVSDYWSVAFLASLHHVAEDVTGAARLALAAGIDVELPHTAGFDDQLLADCSGLIDRAVLRVLTQKAELGLLDAGWDAEQYRSPAD